MLARVDAEDPRPALPREGSGPACGPVVCPWCRRPTRPIAVHGHSQCERCGTNIDPCCGGETAAE